MLLRLIDDSSISRLIDEQSGKIGLWVIEKIQDVDARATKFKCTFQNRKRNGQTLDSQSVVLTGFLLHIEHDRSPTKDKW